MRGGGTAPILKIIEALTLTLPNVTLINDTYEVTQSKVFDANQGDTQMTLSTQTLSHARKLGFGTVLAGIGSLALAALVLPPAAATLVSALALVVPFVAAGLVEGAIDRAAPTARA